MGSDVSQLNFALTKFSSAAHIAPTHCIDLSVKGLTLSVISTDGVGIFEISRVLWARAKVTSHVLSSAGVAKLLSGLMSREAVLKAGLSVVRAVLTRCRSKMLPLRKCRSTRVFASSTREGTMQAFPQKEGTYPKA